MICRIIEQKQVTFPISFTHPSDSIMSLSAQVLYECLKIELPSREKKQPAAHSERK